MHIIIDARSLNQGGIGNVLLGILENLDYNANDYSIIGDRALLEPLNLPCKIIHAKSHPHSFFGYMNHNLAKVINDYDCYLTPNYMIPRGIKINSYFILHDMLFVDNRRYNHRFFTDFIKRNIVKRSYRIASKIFTVSEFSKKRIEAYFGTNKEVTVLHPGVSELLIKNTPKKVVKKDYFVYVGRNRRHKNLKNLLTSLEQLNWPRDLHVIVQKKNLSFKERRDLKRLRKNPHIQILMNLSPKEYVKELSQAYALVDPSYYEGFAANVLEARYTHTPVIVSDIPAHHELLEKSEANFFQPSKISSIKEALIAPVKKVVITKKMREKYNFKKLTDTIVASFSPKRKKDYIRVNFIFNMIYQILVILTPLVTAPYVARVLGPSNIGQFSFAYTMVSYFVIFASLGFEQYAQRAIAQAKADREEQSRIFWQIVLVRLIPVTISLGVLFIFYLTNLFGEYSSLVLFFSILVGGAAFDINFYFHGKENFFLVMIMNLIIRIGFLICVFNFVKTRNDLSLYILLYCLMVFGSYLSMWLALPLNLSRVKLKTLDFKKHMKASLALFLPVAAVGIYAILDKTLIGVLIHGQTYQKVGYITILVNISDLENGFYFQTERLVKALLSIILAFGTVMATRNAIEYSSRRTGSVRKNVYHSIRFVFAIGVPLALGAVAIAPPFVPLFYGQGYEKVALLMMIYAPIIIISGCSNVLGMQYLLATKRDNKYALSVLIGFAANLILNVSLIPFLGSMGAIIGTLISEFIILFVQYLFVHREISLNLILKTIWKYVLAGVIMLAACNAFYFYVLLPTKAITNLLSVIFIMILGSVTYYAILLILRDDYFFIYTKAILVKIAHAFQYMSRSVLSQSKTAAALLDVPSQSKNVKDAHTLVINPKESKKNDKK